jgi:hypothetical protein
MLLKGITVKISQLITNNAVLYTLICLLRVYIQREKLAAS